LTTDHSIVKSRHQNTDLRLNDDLDNAMYKLKLLWSTGRQQGVDTLSHIARIFFSF
jgi:hypothetical protein